MRGKNATENENSYQEAARLTLALRTLRTILECDIKKTATKSSEKKENSLGTPTTITLN